ncbi:MAG TPA: hypothetical protein PLA65_04510 [Spirochaetota bacterium]|nr:hypothetical protein [Spirochaetota bacterium]HPN11297.1 hypothetical protein [Spirochaetota bacterium]
MIRNIAITLALLVPALVFSADIDNSKQMNVRTNIPVLSQYNNTFSIQNLYFNKRIDVTGKGEILEVEFILENLTDDPIDIYLFTIATYEKTEVTKSSFERPIPPKERIRTFVTYPDDIQNFTYPVYDKDGKPQKDENGLDKIKLEKFPKNPKSGVDPSTGKPYHLTDKLVIRTTHISPYRKNYFFFNNLAVLIFDSEGKPAYRKLFEIKGKRGR